MRQSALPIDGLPADVVLEDAHYLGPSKRSRLVFSDRYGVMVFSSPASRHIPREWLELTRWCIQSTESDAGSRQWSSASQWLRRRTNASTVVSYSDPSVGHNGALYRACGWLWAPTWLRLFPPPSGHGAWSDRRESTKDRWVYLLRPDATRERVLSVKDGRIARCQWAQYKEPRWKRGKPQSRSGGGDYKRWRSK
jgi:hypothetical protein